ncbi:MAG: hypothetical protein JWO59_667, partial [Chloroflexi bacterium]|nr:hypothetical protein [Chloroflexota bacterium]
NGQIDEECLVDGKANHAEVHRLPAVRK